MALVEGYFRIARAKGDRLLKASGLCSLKSGKPRRPAMCGHCHDGAPEGGKDRGQDGAKFSAKDRAKDGIDRRSLMALGVAAAATAAGVTRVLAPSPAVAAHSKPTSLCADDALSALKSGNARYVSQPQ